VIIAAPPASWAAEPALTGTRFEGINWDGSFMGKLFATLLVLLSVAIAQPVSALEIGDAAPSFQAESTIGTIKLSDYAGKKNVLLAFYFKDFTGG
jgi:peroxiredoxin Q/BCP